MAFGVFSLSKEGRVRVAVLLRSLLIAQLVISLCMVIFCYNLSLRVMLLLTEIHKVTVILLYGLILLQAYAMKLHYTSGLRLVTWLLKFPHWPRAAPLSGLWAWSGSCVAANGLLVYAACSTTAKALLNELSNSMRVGISQYLVEPSWKRLLDTMQVELSCCGIDKPTDWHEIPWINVDDLNENSRLAMILAGADGKILPPVCPYSCCTPRVLAPCYHDPLQQVEWREAWSAGSPLVPASLHARGCVEAMRGPLTKALLCLKYFNLLVFMLQVFIVFLCQLLRTSARAAAARGDSAGEGCGCILPSFSARALRESVRRVPASETEYCSGESTSLFMLEARRRRRRNRRLPTPKYPLS